MIQIVKDKNDKIISLSFSNMTNNEIEKYGSVISEKFPNFEGYETGYYAEGMMGGSINAKTIKQ